MAKFNHKTSNKNKLTNTEPINLIYYPDYMTQNPIEKQKYIKKERYKTVSKRQQ